MELENTINLSTIKEHKIFHHCKKPITYLKACIILPAKDEAVTITHTLTSLKNQVYFDGGKLDYSIYEVLLLVNNCTDNTYLLAKEFALQNPEFNLHIASINIPAPNANIGYVRKILMEEACHRLSVYNSANGIIVSTDSDTIADKYWLGHIMNEIVDGYDAVGGRILTNKKNDAARIYYLRDISYRLLLATATSIIENNKKNIINRHHQYFGASMAITCDTYKRCGRLPDVTHLEDMALLNSLIKIDAKICYSSLAKVYTSTRTEGRVEIGFSEQLKKWEELKNNNTLQFVESVRAGLMKLECKKILRRCFELFRSNQIIELQFLKIISKDLMISQYWLQQQLMKAIYFGALWQATELEICKGKFYEQYQSIPVTMAIKELRFFLNNHQTFSKTSNL